MAAAKQSAAGARRQRRAADELRADILAAAAELFFESGYQGASIEALIERVGGSKRAVYSHFGGKKELFTALVTEASSRALAALAPEKIATHDLESTLLAFGRQVSDVVMSPTTLGLYRVVVAEGIRFPDLARAFFDGGPGRASARLAGVLEEFRRRGEIEVEDSRRAAEHFIGMLRDDLHLRVVLGLRPPPDAAEIDLSVRQAVGIFLDGCRTKAAGKTGIASGRRLRERRRRR
jgi:AcrR family transcriptional regulator